RGQPGEPSPQPGSQTASALRSERGIDPEQRFEPVGERLQQDDGGPEQDRLERDDAYAPRAAVGDQGDEGYDEEGAPLDDGGFDDGGLDDGGSDDSGRGGEGAGRRGGRGDAGGEPRGGGAIVPGRSAVPAPWAGTRVVQFLQGSWRELQRVQWPDRPQVMQATGVVIGFVIVAGVFLGVADLVATKLVNFILK
ncbi:MAG: preprotein translocase subunit SecE, partial [Solirubrobacteraceae bacterium]